MCFTMFIFKFLASWKSDFCTSFLFQREVNSEQSGMFGILYSSCDMKYLQFQIFPGWLVKMILETLFINLWFSEKTDPQIPFNSFDAFQVSEQCSVLLFLSRAWIPECLLLEYIQYKYVISSANEWNSFVKVSYVSSPSSFQVGYI